jgi:hypothetical protein
MEISIFLPTLLDFPFVLYNPPTMQYKIHFANDNDHDPGVVGRRFAG